MPHHVAANMRNASSSIGKARPFEVVQMDFKYIRDRKALTKEQIIYLDKCEIPNYQWGALDVNSRFKLIAYSREKS